MEELHTDSIDGGHEGQLWARSRARERAYSKKVCLIQTIWTLRYIVVSMIMLSPDVVLASREYILHLTKM
jgi:hypothetical protein